MIGAVTAVGSAVRSRYLSSPILVGFEEPDDIVKEGDGPPDARNYWIDAPTGDEDADRKRGMEYAELTLGAIYADGCSTERPLELIFKGMIEDAIARRKKGGQ